VLGIGQLLAEHQVFQGVNVFAVLQRLLRRRAHVHTRLTRLQTLLEDLRDDHTRLVRLIQLLTEVLQVDLDITDLLEQIEALVEAEEFVHGPEGGVKLL